MPEKYYCGDCGCEFEPKRYFYGGGNLCDDCRNKRSEEIDKTKEAYDRMSSEDKQNIDFASAIESAVPQKSIEITCWKCGTTISDGNMCSYCQREVEAEEREAERNSQEAKKDFEKRINRL